LSNNDKEDAQTHREQGDVISFLIKIKGQDAQTNGQTDGYTDRQQGDLINLLSFSK
jgi:hypothetical protein